LFKVTCISTGCQHHLLYEACSRHEYSVKQQQINQYSAAVQKGVFGNLLQ